MPGTALDTHMHVHCPHLAVAKAAIHFNSTSSARRFRFASAAGPRPCPRPRWAGSECISTCISVSYANNVNSFHSSYCSRSSTSSSSSRLGALWRQLGCQQLVATCSTVDTRICGAATSCTLAALSGRTTAAQQTEQCAQPDE